MITGVEKIKHLSSQGSLRRDKGLRVEKVSIRRRPNSSRASFLEVGRGIRMPTNQTMVKWPELQKTRDRSVLVAWWPGHENWGSGVVLSEGWREEAMSRDVAGVPEGEVLGRRT